MRNTTTLLSMTAVALAGSGASAKVAPLERIPLMEQRLDPVQTVTTVKAARITFAPGQPTGRHRHAVPVVGLVVAGSFVFQIEGQPARTLRQGDAFYEPKDVVIQRFDNASSRRPAIIAGFYLADRLDRPLIEMLPDRDPMRP